MTQNTFSIKEKSDELDFIKTKNVYSLEDIINKIKNQVTNWGGEIWKSPISVFLLRNLPKIPAQPCFLPFIANP